MAQPNSTTDSATGSAERTGGGVVRRGRPVKVGLVDPPPRSPSKNGNIATRIVLNQTDHERLWGIALKHRKPRQRLIQIAVQVLDDMLANLSRGNQLVLRGPDGRWEETITAERLLEGRPWS